MSDQNQTPYGQPAPAYDVRQAESGYAAPPVQKTNTLAIVALVLAFFVQIAAVVCGHIALSQIKKTGEQGRGLAIAALVIGYVVIGLGIIATIVAIVVTFAAIGASSVSGNS